MGLCPFHQEKTPSFHVHPDKSLYKCFGCGKGGNVFSFIMEMEKLSFIEAVTLLAERYNIALPSERPENRETAEQRDALHDVSRFAARFFFNALQSEQGEACRKYLKKRGWDQAVQRRFGLGYAPDSWDALLTTARKEGISADILEEAGLIVRKDGGKEYDRFRNRLMFPIFSTGGKVVGFGARALKPDDQPKYLNSPETAIYNKSQLLYGLSFAVPSIRERDSVVLVEGYADVIAMSQAGFPHAVATSGTALTRPQIRLLIRYTHNILFLYDADSAGANAMLRSIDLFLDEGVIPGIVLLPQGEDPDSYVRNSGAEAFGKALAKPVSFVDFITGKLQQEGKLDTPDGKTEAVRRIVALVSKIDDRLKQEFYLHYISEKYGIYESLLYNELSSQLRTKRTKPPRREEMEPEPDPFLPDAQAVAEQPLAKHEREFMSALLRAPKEIISETLNAIHLTEFQHPGVQHILMTLLEQKEDYGSINVSDLGKSFAGDIALQSLLADLMIDKLEVSARWKDIQTVNDIDFRQLLFDSYRSIILQKISRKLEDNTVRWSRVIGSPEMEHNYASVKRQLDELREIAMAAGAIAELPVLED